MIPGMMKIQEHVIVKKSRPLGFEITTPHLLWAFVAVLMVSNIYFALVYQRAEVDRVNALGLILMQARGPLSESIHIINKTVVIHQIDVGLWELMLRDLIEHWRFYPAISCLDRNHGPQWLLIQDAIDKLIRTVTDVVQVCNTRRIFLLNLTNTLVTSVSSVKDALVLIEMNAFSEHISIGSDPKVIISEINMKKAVEAASLLWIRSEELREFVLA